MNAWCLENVVCFLGQSVNWFCCRWPSQLCSLHFVCVCVCMWVWMWVCVHVCMRVCMRVCVCVYDGSFCLGASCLTNPDLGMTYLPLTKQWKPLCYPSSWRCKFAMVVAHHAAPRSCWGSTSIATARDQPFLQSPTRPPSQRRRCWVAQFWLLLLWTLTSWWVQFFLCLFFSLLFFLFPSSLLSPPHPPQFILSF